MSANVISHAMYVPKLIVLCLAWLPSNQYGYLNELVKHLIIGLFHLPRANQLTWHNY